MPSYRELLQQVKGEITEVDASRARELVDSERPPLLVDVRERDEWTEGFIPGAVHVPRGHLESRIEAAATDRSQAEIDRVLDKISARGMGSLTPAERKFLAEMSRKMRDRH